MNFKKSLAALARWFPCLLLYAETSVATGRRGEDERMNGSIEPPVKVRELLTQLKLEREAHAEILARLSTEETSLQELANQLQAAAGRLESRETAIALSGEPLPEDALPEAVEIERLTRHSRIVRARVQAIGSQARRAASGVESMKVEVQLAFDDFCLESYQSVAVRYREAAEKLRDITCEGAALIVAMGRTPHRRKMSLELGLTVAVGAEGETIVDSRNLNLSSTPKLTLWYRIGGDLYESILRLNRELQEAIQGRDVEPKAAAAVALAQAEPLTNELR
jgi:hypothetical protein